MRLGVTEPVYYLAIATTKRQLWVLGEEVALTSRAKMFVRDYGWVPLRLNQ